jgi:hypothetical protein
VQFRHHAFGLHLPQTVKRPFLNPGTSLRCLAVVGDVLISSSFLPRGSSSTCTNVHRFQMNTRFPVWSLLFSISVPTPVPAPSRAQPPLPFLDTLVPFSRNLVPHPANTAGRPRGGTPNTPRQINNFSNPCSPWI